MSRILNLELFDSERFKQIEDPTDVQLWECIVDGELDGLPESVKEIIESDIILDYKTCGFIDAMLSDIEEPVSEEYEADRSLLVGLLNNISEDNGRLTEKFNQEPHYFGYLTLEETKDLIKILTNLPEELDEGWVHEFKDTLLIVAQKAVQKNLGLIHWAL